MTKQWIICIAATALAATTIASPVPQSSSQSGRAAVEAAANVTQTAQSQRANYFSQVAQVRETCFKSGEQTSGMNKICYYKCSSGDAAITISSVSLCPLSIQK